MHVNQHRKYKTVIKITFDLRLCSCGKVNKKIASHPCYTDDVFELLCLIAADHPQACAKIH